MANRDVHVRFGITPKIVESRESSSDVLPRSDDVSPERIREAIKPLVPLDAGYNLKRIGGRSDGGYLVPDDLEGIEACFSPGTNNFKNFEDHLTNHYGIRAYMCDYTSSVDKMRTPLVPGMQFFEKKWLDVVPGPDNLDINSWVADAASPGTDLILQMDIEGAEYRNVLHASDETLRRFRIAIIEFHGLDLLDDARFLEDIFVPCTKKLSRYFQCVHVHPNNCCGDKEFAPDLTVPCVLEVTFLRKDRAKRPSAQVVLPHPLDEPNVERKSPLQLEGVWLEHADRATSLISGLTQRMKWLETEVSALSTKMVDRVTPSDLYPLLFDTYIAGMTEIAREKQTTQSSYYSVDESRPSGAVDGIKTGRFGFHTKIERNPWWQVDLGAEFEVNAILLFNRLDKGSERIRRLRILVSRTGTDWTTIYDHDGRAAFGGIRPLHGVPPLLVPCRPASGGAPFTVRFVKLLVPGVTALHLDQVEVYGAPH